MLHKVEANSLRMRTVLVVRPCRRTWVVRCVAGASSVPRAWGMGDPGRSSFRGDHGTGRKTDCSHDPIKLRRYLSADLITREDADCQLQEPDSRYR